MKIVINVFGDKVNIYKDNDFVHVIKLGEEDIANYGFVVVNEIVEELIRHIDTSDTIVVNGKNIESKMVARKIEDRVKCEVEYRCGENL